MKKAFTLAETLIAMAIIAVISVMLITNLSKVNPDQNILVYKKTFYSIQEAVRLLINDTTKFPDYEYFFKSRAKDDDPTTQSDDDAEYFCEQMVGVLNTVGKTQCETAETTTQNFVLSNGAYIYNLGKGSKFEDADVDKYIEDHIDICIDTNGTKKPNQGCDGTTSKIRDRFRVRVYYNGKVTTDENWAAENAILEGGARTTKLKLEDYPDTTN